jgi:hypothetical protein
MSDLLYEEISLPLSNKELASSVLAGETHRKTRRVRKLNPRIKEWKICELCGLSFYRTEGSKRKYCSRETCAEALLCVRVR